MLAIESSDQIIIKFPMVVPVVAPAASPTKLHQSINLPFVTLYCLPNGIKHKRMPVNALYLAVARR